MILVLVLSFVPGILWLIWFTRADRVRPEPKRLVAAVFFLGMLSTFPAGLLNDWAGSLLGMHRDSLFGLFVLFFVVVGPVEETLKLLVVRVTVYGHREFDEPIDAFVYASAAALGFASLENLTYGRELGTGVLVLRAILSVPGHVLFSALWAYGLAQQKFHGGSVLPWLAAAALSHGMYDFLVIGGGRLGSVVGLSPEMGQVGTFVLGVVPLVAVQWVVLVRLVKRLAALGREGAGVAAQIDAVAAVAARAAGAPADVGVAVVTETRAGTEAGAGAAPARMMRRSVMLAIVGGGAHRMTSAPRPQRACPECGTNMLTNLPYCSHCGARALPATGTHGTR